MATNTLLRRTALPLHITVLLSLFFTLANPASAALAQGRYELIAEKIEKPGKTKTFSEGDKLTLRSYKTGNRHTGRITAFSDSSLVLDAHEFLFSDIQYIEGRVNVPNVQKLFGLVLIPASLIITFANLMGQSDRDNVFPLLFIGPGVAIISAYLLFHKPVGALGPQTGWQLRVQKTE